MPPPPYLLMLQKRHVDMKRKTEANQRKKLVHCGTRSPNKDMKPPWCCLPRGHLGLCSI